MYRRTAVLASLSVLGAMLFSGPAAQADTGDIVVCQFQGLSGQLVPEIIDIQSDLTEDITSQGGPDIERGAYSYGGGATCAGREADGTAAVDDGVTITSDGTYSNLYCGTGLASDFGGTGTDVIFSNPDVDDVTGIPYTVAFVSGTGPLVVGVGATLNEGNVVPNIAGPGTDVNPDPTRYAGAGLVNIVPKGLVDDPQGHPNGNCANDPVNEFEVTGGFIAVGTLNP